MSYVIVNPDGCTVAAMTMNVETGWRSSGFLGQTAEQIVARLGQPKKIVNLGTKEIYYYPDMKVTFMNGKITDVQ